MLWYVHELMFWDILESMRMDITKNSSSCWINMRLTMEDYMKACATCGEANDPTRKKRHYLQIHVIGNTFERIAIDLAGPFRET